MAAGHWRRDRIAPWPRRRFSILGSIPMNPLGAESEIVDELRLCRRLPAHERSAPAMG
jgi:hypothetical protein